MAYGLTKSLDLELSSTQYASITDASQTGLDITGDITVEAWINIESAAANSRIVSKGDGNNGYYMGLTSSRTLEFAFRNSGGSLSKWSTTSAIGSTSTWIHVAVAVDVSVPSATIYVNGNSVSIVTEATSATAINNNADSFNVGYWQSGNEQLFDGKISLVRVWNDIRTGSEIANNKCNVFGTAEAGMAAEWSFDNVYTDASGNANTLTATNSPIFATDVPGTCGVVSTNSNFLAFF